MLRQIVTPTERQFTLQLPGEMLGKTVEIIAFELNDPHNKPYSENEKALRLKKIQDITKNSLVDLSDFKFNRNEANNYDD